MPTKSQELYQKALRLMPGGVNSPVRAFRAVGGDPLFIANGKGSRLTDADGNSYLDYVLSWDPLILGHCHPEVGSHGTALVPWAFFVTDYPGIRT